MHRNFTQEMLIKYLYNETDVSERQAIKAALRNDPELKSEMDQLNDMQVLLDTEFKAPSSSSIKIILDHSRKSRKLETV